MTAGPSFLEPATGVAVAYLRDGLVLLGRRIAVHGNGLMQLPGGKPDEGEALADTALRELEEETGIRAIVATEVARQVDDFPEVGKRYTTHFFIAVGGSDEPQNREPDKCEGWRWFALDAWPDDLFAITSSTIAAIRQAAAGS
jgi:8-oxo-dGTP diphosphatase